MVASGRGPAEGLRFPVSFATGVPREIHMEMTGSSFQENSFQGTGARRHPLFYSTPFLLPGAQTRWPEAQQLHGLRRGPESGSQAAEAETTEARGLVTAGRVPAQDGLSRQ